MFITKSITLPAVVRLCHQVIQSISELFFYPHPRLFFPLHLHFRNSSTKYENYTFLLPASENACGEAEFRLREKGII